MQFRQLYYFCETAKCGNISQAAKNLHIAQPSLSQIILQFENELGFKVFYRTNGGVVLTTMGQIVLNDAKLILKECDRINRKWKTINRQRETVSGQVRIMVCPTVYAFVERHIIAAVEQLYPNIICELIESRQDSYPDMLQTKQIDLVIGDCHPTPEEPLEARWSLFNCDGDILTEDTWKTAISSKNTFAQKEELSIEDTRQLNLAVFSANDGIAIRYFGRFFEADRIRPFHSFEKILNATTQDVAVSILTEKMTCNGTLPPGEKESLRFMTVDGFSLPGVEYICYPKGHTLTTAVEHVREICFNMFRQDDFSYGTLPTSFAALLEKNYEWSL